MFYDNIDTIEKLEKWLKSVKVINVNIENYYDSYVNRMTCSIVNLDCKVVIDNDNFQVVQSENIDDIIIYYNHLKNEVTIFII